MLKLQDTEGRHKPDKSSSREASATIVITPAADPALESNTFNPMSFSDCVQGHRGTEAPRHRGTEAPRQGHRGTGVPGHRGTGYRGIGAQGHRGVECGWSKHI